MAIKRLKALLLSAILAVIWAVVPVRAQSTCPYADIRLDTGQPVDQEAICQAARPWADDGFQVLVFLTDYRPADEDAWFARLDQVEIEAGLRNREQPDQFETGGIALEATTATDLPWAYSVTIGERLYDSALDTDSAIGKVEGHLRNGIKAGDPTDAFVQALAASYELYTAPAAPQAAEPQPILPAEEPAAEPAPVESKTDGSSASSSWIWVVVGVLGVGALGAGSYGLTVKVINPALRRARRRRELKQHLEVLRSRTSNLLNACEPLLRGEAPQETVLYQLFGAYGGEQSEILRDDVYEWLRRSQEALDDAFDLRQKLIAPDVEQKRTLEQLVDDWEMLYLTFVGNSERILSLTDSELHTLLDPMLVLDREQADVQLARQLDDIRRELAGEEMPFKVELMMVDPTQTDTEGILGYLDQVKAKIAYLQEARRQAPQRLAEARETRQAAGEEVPDPFVMTEKQLFAGIDARLAQAAQDLQQDLFLRALEQIDQILGDTETVREFVAAVGEHHRRQAEVETITAQGYRPPRLEDDWVEIQTDVETIIQAITDGDYEQAGLGVEELAADSQRALAGSQVWQALHEQNATELDRLQAEAARIEAFRTAEAEPAWQTLQTWPPGNWQEVADGRQKATQTLQSLHDEGFARLERLNSLEEQSLEEVEEKLVQVSADLTQAEGALQALVNRLAEVRTAEAQIEGALRLTEADLLEATQFRDQEDVKIDPQVDEQIEGARRQLAQAQEAAQAREFIAAVVAQTAARQLANLAHESASQQVNQINAFLEELEVTARGVSSNAEQCQAELQALPAPARSKEADEIVQQVMDGLSKAQQARTAVGGLEDQALSAALQAAVESYREVGYWADQAINRIRADRHEYDHLLTEARQALSAAQAAIQQAEWVVREPDAQGAGQRALERAKSTLPQFGPTLDAPKSALERIRKQADETRRHAQQAQSQARSKAQAVRAERERRRRRESSSGGWSWSSGSGGSSSSSSSGSSSRRSSWGSSSRRSSSGSSRRRSSSGGSRRR